MTRPRVPFTPVSEKLPPKPVWIKNTYFWIAAALVVLSILAMVKGDAAIRDPGQKREGGLAIWYLIAAASMYVNGWISHRQTVQHYQEAIGSVKKDES